MNSSHLCLAALILLSIPACKKFTNVQGTDGNDSCTKNRPIRTGAVSADISGLKPNDAKALQKINRGCAADRRNLFPPGLAKNPDMLNRLKADTSEQEKNGFIIFLSIWTLAAAGTTAALFWTAFRPTAGAGRYYPEDMTKEEFNTWLSTLDEKTKEQAVGFFTLIRRDARKKLKIVPYSEEYRSWLTPAAKTAGRSCSIDRQPVAKKISSRAGRRFSEQRLLCKRYRMDGTRRADRCYNRTV